MNLERLAMTAELTQCISLEWSSAFLLDLYYYDIHQNSKRFAMVGRKCILTALIPILIHQSGCKNIIEPDNETEVIKEEFNEYHGYFYKGPRYSTDTTLVYHFFNKANFDKMFQLSPPPFEPDTIPSSEFFKKEVIAIVKYGNKYFELKVNSVERMEEVIYVKYKSELKADSMRWTAAIPMIVTTKGGYKIIKIFENAELIKEIVL